MSRPSKFDNMFIFSLAMLLGTFASCTRYVESYFFGKGQERNIKGSSKSWIFNKVPTLGFYLAATIIAGTAYIQGDHGSDDSSDHGSEYGSDVSNIFTVDSEDDKNRFLIQVVRGLAESSDKSEVAINCDDVNHLPMLLILVGFFCEWLYLIFSFCLCSRSKEELEKITIPLNADYAIHRYGEVAMLILGESVLSLLVVKTRHDNPKVYWQVFFAGVTTLILLQILHYRSMPHDPENHAFRNHNRKMIVFMLAFQLYSAVLIMIGAAYKLFLKDIKNEDYDSKHRLLLKQMQEMLPEYFDEEDNKRFLAGDTNTIDMCSLSVYNRKTLIIDLFGWAMAVAFTTLSIMVTANIGWREKLKIWKKKPLAAIAVAFTRFVLIVMMFTIFIWEEDIEHLAWIGLAAVFVQLITRYVEDIVFPQEHKHDHHSHGDFVSQEILADDSSHHSQ